MTSPDRPHHRLQSFEGLGLYFVMAVLLFGRGLVGHPGDFIGRYADPAAYIWYLRWWRYALDHRVNPFLTDLLWAPRGFNLAWAALIPLPAWIAIPIEPALGETAAYNILCIFALPLAAGSAFLLCLRLTGAFWPSILGGYIFGFSPYMLAHLLGGHLNLVLAFPVPLAVLSGLRRIEGESSARRFTLEIAGLLIVQFLCGIELFATMTIFAGFALLSAIVFFSGETRARLLNLVGPLSAAYAIAMIVVSPYLYYLLAHGRPSVPLWPSGEFTADLLNFFIPTNTNLLGIFGFTRTITEKFSSVIFEDNAYIGIPLLLIIEAYRRFAWPTAAGKFLIVMLAIAVVASFGPALRVAGRALFPMPWVLFTMLPVISSALTARFAMYASLVISLIAAIWLSSAPVRWSTKGLAAALVVLFLAPNPSAAFWISSPRIPAFFTDRTYAKELSPREIILALPFAQNGNSMYWQVKSDMYFRMAGAAIGTFSFEFRRMPVVNYFYGAIDLPEAGDQLKAYLARFEVRAIVADPADPRFDSWQPMFAGLGLPAENIGGVRLYQIPADAFAPYRRLSGAQVEARADALRFDTILEAAGKYLAGGNDPAKLSALELKRLDLLPHDWLVDAAPHAYFDWQIVAASGGQVGITIVGSYEGVKPLLERYRTIASEIDYPAPARWTPDSNPRSDVIKPLLVIFDRAQFEAAAAKLKSSPPPELTTPFLGPESR